MNGMRYNITTSFPPTIRNAKIYFKKEICDCFIIRYTYPSINQFFIFKLTYDWLISAYISSFLPFGLKSGASNKAPHRAHVFCPYSASSKNFVPHCLPIIWSAGKFYLHFLFSPLASIFLRMSKSLPRFCSLTFYLIDAHYNHSCNVLHVVSSYSLLNAPALLFVEPER